MSDLIQRAIQAQEEIGNSSLPKWRRMLNGLREFSGLELGELDDDVRTQLEADLVGVNVILEHYPLEIDEDYRAISDEDLDELCQIVENAASRAITAELDRIVAGIDADSNVLPVEAIREARQHRDLMIPRLIDVIKEAADEVEAGNKVGKNGHFFALFLLSEFRAEESLPTILEAVSLPGEMPFDLFGDAITSTLARILSQFAGNRPEVMDGLIANREVNEYVRWEGAQAYVYLVRDGLLSRDEAVERLQQHLHRAVEQEDTEIAGPLVSVLCSFAPQEALEVITEAYNRALVEPFLVCLEDVHQSIDEGELGAQKYLNSCLPTGIENTIEELQRWAGFQEKKPKPERRPLPPPPHFEKIHDGREPEFAAVSFRDKRVGRNEPCPCGSGKKFKKCCARVK